MNLQQLEYIVSLEKHRSFSRAAEACHVTQATLSTMVKRLEEELGLALFDRTFNPVIPTDCGLELIHEAQQVLLHTNRIKELSASAQGKIAGKLELGIIPTVAGSLLPRILPVLLKKYPLMELRVRELPTEGIIRELKDGTLDAGILSTPLQGTELKEELLYYEKLLVYGKSGRTNTRYHSPADLSNGDLWLLEEGNCLTDQVRKLCSLNRKKLHPSLHFLPGSFDSLLNMVDQLNGLTLLPELYTRDLPDDRKKKLRDFHHPFPVREISLVSYRPAIKARLTQALASEIRAVIIPQLQTGKLKNSEMLIAGM